MAAYRIVHEGLTNALKHSAAPEANVQLCYLRDSLHLRISNALTVDAPPRAGTGSSGCASESYQAMRIVRSGGGATTSRR